MNNIWASGGVYVKHCRTAFKKQVFPKLKKPAPTLRTDVQFANYSNEHRHDTIIRVLQLSNTAKLTTLNWTFATLPSGYSAREGGATGKSCQIIRIHEK